MVGVVLDDDEMAVGTQQPAERGGDAWHIGREVQGVGGEDPIEGVEVGRQGLAKVKLARRDRHVRESTAQIGREGAEGRQVAIGREDAAVGAQQIREGQRECPAAGAQLQPARTGPLHAAADQRDVIGVVHAPMLPAVSGSPSRCCGHSRVLPADPAVSRVPPPGASSRPGFHLPMLCPAPGSATRCSSGVHFGSWDARRHAANAPSCASCTWADHPAVQGPAPTARAASSGSPNVACRPATPKMHTRRSWPRSGPDREMPGPVRPWPEPEGGSGPGPGRVPAAGAHLVCISGAGTREGVPRMPLPALRAHGLIIRPSKAAPKTRAGALALAERCLSAPSATDAHQAIVAEVRPRAGDASARGTAEKDEDYALSPRAARNSS